MAKKEESDEEKSPLAFLDRLLDDERDSNLHFGDVRFWKHLEYIDTNHIYRTKSLEYRTMKMMFCEACFYLMFLSVLTQFIVSQRSNDFFASRMQQLDYWGGCSRNAGTRTCTLYDVKDPDTLMSWVRDDFVPKAFTSADHYPSLVESLSVFRMQDGTTNWIPRYIGDTQTSLLVGKVRLRQLRVQYNKDCSILEDYQVVQTDCFPRFTEGAMSKITWAPTWAPSHLNEHFDFTDRNRTQQRPMAGLHGKYPGDGFVMDLPTNLTGAQTRLDELASWRWVDFRTRAFIIELNTLNPNVNVFVHSRILFEFPATGGVIAKQEAFPFRASQLSLSMMYSDDPQGVFIYFLLTCASHLMLFCYVCFLIFKNGLQYFTYFWSIMDLIILFFFVIELGSVFTTFGAANSMPSLAPETIGDPEMFFPIGNLVPEMEFSASILSGLGLLCWIKILKYFSLINAFQPYVRVIERCIINLLFFSGLLFVVLFGFSLALHIGYGGESDLFSSLWGGLVAVLAAPAGGVDFSSVFDDDDMLGPILVLVYIAIIVLLLLNTFAAIVVDTYSVCTFQMNEVKKNGSANPTTIFLWTYGNALRGVKLVGKETDEDKGAPDEQQIALTSLPEAVAQKYTETKRKMEFILNSAEGEMEERRLQRLRERGDLDPLPGASSENLDPNQLAIGGPQGNLMITDQEGNGNGPAPPAPLGTKPLPPPEDPNAFIVKRVQLQRMLDDDQVLQEVCGTRKAVDVVRRFRVDKSTTDPFSAVANLQKLVAAKLRELEEEGADLTFDEMETLKSVSVELHSALTESQKEWRAELLTVMQMASLLSQSLIELTRGLETVQLNHNNLATRAGPG